MLEHENPDGDGHKGEPGDPSATFKGPVIDVEKIKRQDGLFTIGSTQSQSLLHRVISAEKDNKNYRQELKTALFATSDEADEAVSALSECTVLGMDPTPIIDQIIARSAGKNHDLLYEALRTLTHTSFTTNYQKEKNAKQRGSNRPFS